MTFSRKKVLALCVCTLLALISFPGYVDCANKKGSQAAAVAPPPAPIEPEAVIEEVNAKQLEKLLTDKDYVAVFWCKYTGVSRWGQVWCGCKAFRNRCFFAHYRNRLE
ncbi:unnamed protein product [Ceratitis capitata]|uniref:(Mediterranean fruit fly) hypothetical protein n=1 Tax=Ceratitis capitata TaxID=7213 RepID=A0A811VI56_CERCA|nr:unnamed protein product [Ceratitis capitata]